MQVSFTGLDIVSGKLEEGRKFPDSKAELRFKPTNDDSADLDGLKQVLKNHSEYASKDEYVSINAIVDSNVRGIFKKFLFNGKEIPIDTKFADMFSFIANSSKKIANSDTSEIIGGVKSAACNIFAEADIAMRKLFTL